MRLSGLEFGSFGLHGFGAGFEGFAMLLVL
jgi:hypothetical protein